MKLCTLTQGLWCCSTLLLTACGGGGGNTNTPNPPLNFFSPTATVIEVPVPFQSGNASATVNAVMDVNGDGKKDLVVHTWTAAYPPGQTGPNPTPNKLYIFIQMPNGTFTDQTASYLVDGNDNLGGASRKVKIADLNADGKLDLVYAINQEDGRTIPPGENWADAQMAALISVGSRYKVVQFGQDSWYHAVGVGYDSAGGIFALGAGYTARNDGSFYFDPDGSITLVANTLPVISATAFELFSTVGPSAASDRLIQPATTGTNYLTLEGYVKSGSNNWVSLAPLSLAPQVGTTIQIGYDGSSQGVAPAFEVGGKIIGFAGLSESCLLKITPSSPPTVVFKISGAEVPNFSEGIIFRQTTGTPVSLLAGVKISNGGLERVPLNINGEVVNNLNSNFFDCKDINGDGHDDIVVYPYNADGRPYVYLNDRNGRFNAVAMSKFPLISDSWSNSATSIMDDFDGDGVPDILIFPGNGISGVTSVGWRLFKGLRPLQ